MQQSRSKNKYNKKLTAQLIKHCIPTKLQQLNTTAYRRATHADNKIQETIDKVKKKCIVCAEKKCRKLGMENVDFSPTVIIWKHRIDTWNIILRRLRGRRVSSLLIKRQAKKYGITRPLSTTIEDAIKELKKMQRRVL